jgi:ClpX C4-type zinc finger protein
MADTKTSEPAVDEVFARCSFCTKSNLEVERLIAGPGVYICDSCVGLCTTILDDVRDIGPSPTPRLPEWRQLDDEQMLEHIPRIAATNRQVEDSLHAWIGELRRRGVTWTRIGGALGMTRQSAWERFSGEE